MSTVTASAGVSFGAHLKKQNIFFYLSALSSVAIIALMFVPWITEPKSASLLTLLLDCKKSTELLFFMIPVMLGVVITHVLYLVTMLRPDGEAKFMGTVTVLLAGLMIILVLFATDIGYQAIQVAGANDASDDLLAFFGMDHWTIVPLIWFVLTLLQKLVFAKIAHKKKVISYT